MPPDIEALARERLMEWLPGAKIERAPDAAVDGVLVWQGPRGTIRYVIEFKKHLPQQDIQVLARRLEQHAKDLPKTKAVARPLLLAPYVPPKQAAFLRGRGINYADEVGNAYLQAPGVLVHIEGRRPAVTTTARGGITKGWVKVTLAGLLNPALFEGPYHQLAAAAGVTAPTVMTCLRDLQRRGLIDGRRPRRRLVGRRELLPLWTQAYVNTLRPRLAERRFRMMTADDPQAVLARMNDVFMAHRIGWCLTGAAAALELTHYYRAGVVEIYAAPRAFTDVIARQLKAQPTEGEANFVVIEPPIPGVVPAPTAHKRPLPMAPALLAYAELRFHGTGQADEAAELLLPLIEGRDDATT
ncbi:MAG: type IV toxin-antitoxin system AbiEi family antitoxin [Vicinamibacterales bacterium]